LIVAAPHVHPVAALREYGHHHREIWPFRSGFVVATFEQVTTDMGSVILRLNNRFGTELEPFVHDPANVEAAFAAVERRHAAVYGDRAGHVLPTPSTTRRPANERARQGLLAPRLAGLRARAEEIYEELAALTTQ
jgi:hypothetical protein